MSLREQYMIAGVLSPPPPWTRDFGVPSIKSWALSLAMVPTGMNALVTEMVKGLFYSPFPLVYATTYKSHLTPTLFVSKHHLYKAKGT